MSLTEPGPTCDGTEQPQSGGVPIVLVDHPLRGRHRDWDGQSDRLMELSSAGLYGHDRGHGNPVTQQFCCQLGGDRLGLEIKIKIKIKNIKVKVKVKMK